MYAPLASVRQRESTAQFQCRKLIPLANRCWPYTLTSSYSWTSGFGLGTSLSINAHQGGLKYQICPRASPLQLLNDPANNSTSSIDKTCLASNQWSLVNVSETGH